MHIPTLLRGSVPILVGLFLLGAPQPATAGAGSYEIISKEILVIDTPVKNGRYEAEVACPKGKKALSAVISLPVVLPNFPKPDGTAWQFMWYAKNPGNRSLDEAIQANGNRFDVQVVCANVK